MADANGDKPTAGGDGDGPGEAPQGVVIPPAEMKSTIEKTAPYCARNSAMEERLRVDGIRGSNEKVSFLDPKSPYYAYFKWRVDEHREGRAGDVSTSAPKTDITFRGREVKVPEKPAEWRFSARMPNISAQDLDVVKLTARYTAKNGKAWLTALSRHEAGNPQFEFLLPQHTLNMFFNRLTEQYQELFDGDTVDNGQPEKDRIAELQRNVQGSEHILERARKRAEYIQWQEKQKAEKDEKAEAERVAFAQIDWHDFEIVGTIFFTEDDEQAELPTPLTLNDIQSASLEQKAAMRIGVDRRLEEAVPDFIYGGPTPLPAAQLPAHNSQFSPPVAGMAYPPPGMPYPPPVVADSDAERARAAAQAATNQPNRIRNDYIPQAQRRKLAPATSICPNCMQRIANDELEEHIRIEMLDPRWQEQRAKHMQRNATTNLSTAFAPEHLKRLASQRTDVFDPVTGQEVADDELARRKRVQMNAYDGVSAPPGGIGHPAGHDRPDLRAQIQGIHAKYGPQNHG